MQLQPFPQTAIKYIIKECLMPYKWTFLVCLLFVLAEISVFNLLDWLFAKMVDGILRYDVYVYSGQSYRGKIEGKIRKSFCIKGLWSWIYGFGTGGSLRA